MAFTLYAILRSAFSVLLTTFGFGDTNMGVPLWARGFAPYAPRLVRTYQGAIRQTVSK
jgi:hypothetical protein